MTDETFDPDFATSADWARLYRRLGLQCVPANAPVKGKQWKRPSIDWKQHQHKLADDDTFLSWFPPTYSGNIGILTGSCSGNLVVIDGDTYKGPEHQSWWNGLIAVHNNGMEVETVMARTGGGGIHRWFRFPQGVTVPCGVVASIRTDIRAEGGFIVAPPSRHDSGAFYEFLPGCGPHEIEIADAPDWLVEAVLALSGTSTLGNPSIPPSAAPAATIDGSVDDGREHMMTKCVWGALTDLRQLHQAIPEDGFTAELADAYERYEQQVSPRDRDRAHGTKSERLERENRGYSLFVEKWRAGLRQWDNKLAQHAQNPTTPAHKPDPEDEEYGAPQVHDHAPAANAHDDAPDPKPLQIADPFEEAVVPDFPTHILGPKLQQLIRDMSDAMGADPNSVAMCMLAAAGAALDQRFKVDMQRGANFMMPPRVWPLLIGDPSTMKTPVIKAALRPLTRLDTENQRDYQRAYARWKEQDKDTRGPEPDKPTRFVLEDATTEKLHSVCADQDRGVALMLDEMSRFSQSSKSARGGLSDPDRAMYAKFFDGDRFVLDRIGRGTVLAEVFGGTILGGLQPDTLASMANLAENGLMQRFVTIIVRKMRRGQPVDFSNLAMWWDSLLERLTTLQPVTVACTPEAERLFLDFGGDIVDIVSYAEASNHFKSAMGKLRGLVGSIALILHLMEGRYGSRLEADTARKAIELCRSFIIPHQLVFYEMCEGGFTGTTVGKVASWLLASEEMRVTPRDLMINIKALRGKAQGEVSGLMSQFVMMGWVAEEMDAKGYKTKAWLVRRGLREHFDERRRAIQDGRRRTYEMLNEFKTNREAAPQPDGPRARDNIDNIGI